jgi:hypothetical protein
MKYTPHKFQSVAIDHAVQFLRAASPGQRTLYSAPTGTGKSIVELCVQAAVPGSWIVSPREEIIDGMLDKLNRAGTRDVDSCICTPVRLRNMLLRGDVQTPAALILDESHHESAETYQQLDLLCGLAPAVGYTATPYRGTPRSTKQFLERWGDPVQIISCIEAAREGYLSLPSFEQLALVDDDVVEVTASGEFDILSLESATVDRLSDAALHSQRWCKDGLWDRPTVFAVPSTACAVRLQQELNRLGLPALTVLGGTPRDERKLAFRAVEARVTALVNIQVVSEGVDLRLRRYVDLSPTMSPVNWVQKLGRITRPVQAGEAPPEYVCTNRNTLRHAYVLEGCVPTSAVSEAQKQFPEARRAHSRVLGLEAIGRFKPVGVKLLNGLTAHVYSLSLLSAEGLHVQYCVLVPPADAPLWASRVNMRSEEGKQYGTWQLCDPPANMRGFASVSPRDPTEKQGNWWKRSAARYGLDPGQKLDAKMFQALPVLADTGTRLV